MQNLIELFFDIPRLYKRVVTLFFDACFIAMSFALAIYIRVGDEGLRWVDKNVIYVSAALIPLTLLFWIRLGLYRAIIRYMDIKVLSNILWGSVGSTVLFVSLVFAFNVELLRSIPFIYMTLILIFVAGTRLFVRGLINAQTAQGLMKVVIYGAGSSGRQLCLSLQNGHEYSPVVFVDDNLQLQGACVSDVPVVSPDVLPEIVQKHMVKKILLAMPSASSTQQKFILNKLESLGIEILTIPGTADLVSGKVSVSQLRTINIQDLLGREQVAPNQRLLDKCVKGKNVLVSGAGGSIGSELCRQIFHQNPATIVLFEISEVALYSIEKELTDSLKKIDHSIEIAPILGNVQNGELLEKVIEAYEINTIYHAAAYKHVPLVEYNVESGIRNNVWGTKALAEAAVKCNVENFVLISTDKAVRPTNIMGTTKRLAELVLQSLAELKVGKTRFSMVRFGNVLGSSGSVVPLFKKQIEKGGPVTITHKDITRYFMTIPEAAQLVVQAGSMGTGGEVYVLDMGNSVKINDLAKKMIHLAGLTVKSEFNLSGDIEIVYSGLRPGEKLYEELLIGENVEGTQHTRIMKAKEISMSWDTLCKLLSELDNALVERDIFKVRTILEEAQLGYNPSSEIADCLTVLKTSNSKTFDNRIEEALRLVKQ